MGGEEGQRIRGGALGLGLLLGGAVFAHGVECGATKAEILAINDDGEGAASGGVWGLRSYSRMCNESISRMKFFFHHEMYDPINI